MKYTKLYLNQQTLIYLISYPIIIAELCQRWNRQA